MKQKHSSSPTGGLHRVSEHANRIRSSAKKESPLHSIEILDALLSKHRRVRKELEQYLAPTAAKYGNRKAAAELERLDKDFLSMGIHKVPMKDDELSHLACEASKICKLMIARFGYSDRAIQHCRFRCAHNGLEPLNQRHLGLIPVLNRYSCEAWWRRRFLKIHSRCVENFFREIGVVQRTRQSYVSDWNISRRKDQLLQHDEFFKRFDVVSDRGDVLALDDVVKSSISNPRNRRAELMTRLRGMEEIAHTIGDACVFVTLTSPSRFHRTTSSGKPNGKYDGSTPIDAQEWLKTCWARTRAALHRRDIDIYGFRIAEPHHDGTPHWHILVYTKTRNIDAIKELVLRYWLADDGDEPGAANHRVRFVDIDSKKGSATGYVAKYVSKAIDGTHIDSDKAVNRGTEASMRIVASCATWGIRQFQQIGGPPVSVWRELRRVASRVVDPMLEKIRQYADQGEWRSFVFAMGGSHRSRKEQRVHLVSNPADTPPSRYGDTAKPGIIGDSRGSFFLPTRIRTWKLQERLAA